jgi:hypothetical protein
MERKGPNSQQIADEVVRGWARKDDDAAVLVYRHGTMGSAQ